MASSLGTSQDGEQGVDGVVEERITSAVMYGTLHYRVDLGSELELVIREVVLVAQVTGHRVTFTFNGTEMVVKPKDTVADVKVQYQSKRKEFLS